MSRTPVSSALEQSNSDLPSIPVCIPSTLTYSSSSNFLTPPELIQFLPGHLHYPTSYAHVPHPPYRPIPSLRLPHSRLFLLDRRTHPRCPSGGHICPFRTLLCPAPIAKRQSRLDYARSEPRLCPPGPRKSQPRHDPGGSGSRSSRRR